MRGSAAGAAISLAIASADWSLLDKVCFLHFVFL
jgi:hypothetical protein